MKRKARTFISSSLSRTKRPRLGPVSPLQASLLQAAEVSILKRKVNKLTANVEKKWIQAVGTYTSSLDASSSVYRSSIGFSDIPNGTTSTSRIGDSVTVTRLRVNVVLTTNPSVLAPTTFRVGIFRDKQQSGSGSIAASTPVGTPNSPYENTTLGFIQPGSFLKNAETSARYVWYRDQTFVLNPQVVYATSTGTTTQVLSVAKSFTWDISIPSVKINYLDSGALNSSVLNNMFQMVVMAPTNIGGFPPTISIGSEIFFTDS